MDDSSTKTLIIALAAALPIICLIALGIVLWHCTRRRSSSRIFNRGTSPVADEEIASWKCDKTLYDEKHGLHHRHTSSDEDYLYADDDEDDNNNNKGCNPKRQPLLPTSSRLPYAQHNHHPSSGSSVQKPPSVIVYHNSPRISSDHHHHHSPRVGSCSSSSHPGSPLFGGSPRFGTSTSGFTHDRTASDSTSIAPLSPVLARAPNARPGLTDDSVRGDSPFISLAPSQTRRLTKTAPVSMLPPPFTCSPTSPISSSPLLFSRSHSRHQSAYTIFMGSRDGWFGGGGGMNEQHTSRQHDSTTTTGGGSAGVGTAAIHGSKRRSRGATFSASPSSPCTAPGFIIATPRMSLDCDMPSAPSPGGLSPRPYLHKFEIGRAIG